MVDNNPNKTDELIQPSASWLERLIPFVIMAIILFLDQFLKFLVESRLDLYEIWAPFPNLESYFRIFHTSNTGAAFGLFQGGSIIFGLFAVVVVGAIIYFNFILPGDSRLMRIGLGLVMGGALGNLIDRIRLGHVTDFLDFGPVPIFNIADASVVVGTILIAILMLLEDYTEESQDELVSADDNESSDLH